MDLMTRNYVNAKNGNNLFARSFSNSLQGNSLLENYILARLTNR